MDSTNLSHSNIAQAWQDFLKHITTMAVIFAATIGIYILDLSVYFAIILVGQVVGSAELQPLFEVAANIITIPLDIALSLVGVLFSAVPAVYYSQDKRVGPKEAFSLLYRRFWRYLAAGIVYTVFCTLGLLFCIVPGLIVGLAMPIYVDRVFNSDQDPVQALSSSINALFKSGKGWEFVGIQLLTGFISLVLMVCTCGLGILAAPAGLFYVQRIGRLKGVIR